MRLKLHLFVFIVLSLVLVSCTEPDGTIKGSVLPEDQVQINRNLWVLWDLDEGELCLVDTTEGQQGAVDCQSDDRSPMYMYSGRELGNYQVEIWAFPKQGYAAWAARPLP